MRKKEAVEGYTKSNKGCLEEAKEMNLGLAIRKTERKCGYYI